MRPSRTVVLFLAMMLYGCGPAATPAPGTSFAASRPGCDNCAWWVTEQFEPRDFIVGGLPISTINPQWSAATALNRTLLPIGAVDEPGQLDEPEFGFEKHGDFNGDGRSDWVLVGVYRTRFGNTGRFLVVLTQIATGRWEKAFLSEIPGDAGFSILQHKEFDVLRWWMCMSCDSGEQLCWDGKRFYLRDIAPCD